MVSPAGRNRAFRTLKEVQTPSINHAPRVHTRALWVTLPKGDGIDRISSVAAMGDPNRWAELRNDGFGKHVFRSSRPVQAAGLVLGGSAAMVAGFLVNPNSSWSIIGQLLAAMGAGTAIIGFIYLTGRVAIDGNRIKSRWLFHSRSAPIASLCAINLDVKTLWGNVVWVPVAILDDGSEVALAALSMRMASKSSRSKVREAAVELRKLTGVGGTDRL